MTDTSPITNGQAVRFLVTNDPYAAEAIRELRKARARVGAGLALAAKVEALRQFDAQPFKF